MIGVDRGHHRNGVGTRLLRAVEADLRDRGQRLLLIETSATPAFDRARAFYLSCGYDEEARVRDYYETGDDMVLFRKAFAAPSVASRCTLNGRAGKEGVRDGLIGGPGS